MNTIRLTREQHDQVKQAACFQWVGILQSLAGLTDDQVSIKAGKAGTPCPLCGGTDRYSFKGEDKGDWACRRCGGGDGWEMLKSVNSWDFPTAAAAVAQHLGMVAGSPTVDLTALRLEMEEKRRIEWQKAVQAVEVATTKERAIWEQSTKVKEHQWVKHKRLSPCALAVCRQHDTRNPDAPIRDKNNWYEVGNKLLIPVFSPAGERVSHQWVAETAPGCFKKGFHAGIPVAGGFVAFGDEKSYTVLVAESFADADAVLQLAECSRMAFRAVCAFSAGQIPAVVEHIRRKYPKVEIVICADNDESGREAVAKAAARVPCVGVSYPPSGKDWSEYLLSGGTESPLSSYTVLGAMGTPPAGGSDVASFPPQEEEYQWPDVLPLNTGLSPVAPITPDMVPDELQEWLVDICDRIGGAPFEYAAVAAVVALGSLIGRKVGIHPKGLDDWLVIPNVWGGLIGRPTTKKTPVAKEVMKPLNDLEKEARSRFDDDMKAFKARSKIEEVLNKDAEKRAAVLVKQGDISGAELLLSDAAATTPDKPTLRRYIVNDATVEKLGIILEQNQQGILLFRDELSGWLLGLTREDRQHERAFYLEAWNGDGTFSYDRIGRDDVFMKSTTVSVLGGIQPGRLLPLLNGQANGSGDDGLVERLQLAVYPDKPPFTYIDRAPNKAAADKANAVFQRLDRIPFDIDQPTPTLRFTPDAQERFAQWYVEINEYLHRDGIPPLVESHFGKFCSLIPALALIFHIVDKGHETPVSLEALERAIQWGNVLKTHAGRVYGLADDRVGGARILSERLSELPNPFKKRNVEKKGWSLLTDGSSVDKALAVLVDHGHLVEVSTPPVGGRGRPSVNYWINPAAIEQD